MWVGPCGAWSLLACGLADPAEPASSLPASDGEGTSWEVLRAGRGGGRPFALLTRSLPAAAASGRSSASPRSWDGCWEPSAVLPLPMIYQSYSPRRLGLAAEPRLGGSCNLHRRPPGGAVPGPESRQAQGGVGATQSYAPGEAAGPRVLRNCHPAAGFSHLPAQRKQ